MFNNLLNGLVLVFRILIRCYQYYPECYLSQSLWPNALAKSRKILLSYEIHRIHSFRLDRVEIETPIIICSFDIRNLHVAGVSLNSNLFRHVHSFCSLHLPLSAMHFHIYKSTQHNHFYVLILIAWHFFLLEESKQVPCCWISKDGWEILWN